MTIKLHRDQFLWTNGRGHNQKPILYSQKPNNYGLGKKEHTTDQWWATAFDNQLKSLQVSNSSSSSSAGEITVTQTNKTNATPLGMGIASRYYIRFVRGGLLTSGGEVRGEGGEEEEVVSRKKKKKKEEKKEKERKKKREKKEEKGSSESSAATSAGSKQEKGKDKKRRGADGSREERREKKRLRRLLDKEMASLRTVAAEG